MDSSNAADCNCSEDPTFHGRVSDITKKFVAACQCALRPGELCHPPWFNLQYSMSAIEIMDPKMDIRASGTRHVLSIQEALSTKSLPLSPFTSAKELLGIMDELLCAFVNWLTGDSLAQTVFCCMYMHCTQLVQDTRLAVFCEMLRRSVRQLRCLIVSVNVISEEDHCAPTDGMPLHRSDPHFDCFLNTLSIPVRVDSLTSSGLFEMVQHVILELPEFSSTSDTNPWACVRVRLEFMHHLLKFSELLTHFLNSIRDMDLQEYEMDDFAVPDGEPELATKQSQETPLSPVEDITDFLDRLRDFCSSYQSEADILNKLAIVLSSTSNAGDPAGPGRTSPKDFAYGIPGFEPFLNQTKLPPCIPRFVVMHTRSAAFTYLHDFFSYLLNFTGFVQTLSCLLPRFGKNAYELHWLWSVLKANGQTPRYSVPELSTSSPGSVFDSNSCAISRTLTSLLHCYSFGRLHSTVRLAPVQTDIVIESWLRLEPLPYQSAIRSILSEVNGLRDFFDMVGDHIYQQLLRLYGFNRSRQRIALVQWINRMGELLEECLIIEWVIGKELSKRLGSSDVESPEPCALQLASYLCYYYYVMAWDYVVSGFQLELYSSHEWIFMYTFLIQLLQQLFTLVERFTQTKAQSLSVQPMGKACNGLLPAGASWSNDSNSDHLAEKSQSKRKRHKQRSKNPNSDVRVSDRTEEAGALSTFCGPLSELELLILTIHRLLTAATMYVLRALQLDCGGDPVLDSSDTCPQLGYGDPVEIYARRLGLFLAQSNSPLMDPAGVSGAFESCRRYVTTGLFSGSTTELYAQAMRSFDNARIRIQLAIKQYGAHLDQLNFCAHGTCEKFRISDEWMQRLFGSPDLLADLERLATRNAIACRVLATCPERRPVPLSQGRSLQTKCSFLLSQSPVRVEFDHLSSRSYPQIRLVTASSSSATAN